MDLKEANAIGNLARWTLTSVMLLGYSVFDFHPVYFAATLVTITRTGDMLVRWRTLRHKRLKKQNRRRNQKATPPLTEEKINVKER